MKTYAVVQVLCDLAETDDSVGANSWLLVCLKLAQISQQVIVDGLV